MLTAFMKSSLTQQDIFPSTKDIWYLALFLTLPLSLSPFLYLSLFLSLRCIAAGTALHGNGLHNIRDARGRAGGCDCTGNSCGRV